MSTLPFTNFTKGEIAPALQARIDTNQYSAGAKKVRNFIIQRYGGLSFRPGFRFVGEADNVEDDMLYIPFQFNIEQAYIMAMGDENMRLMAKGGMVIEEDVAITAITKAVNAQVTALYHGLSVGDRIFLSGISGMVELNGREAVVASVIDDDNFTIDIDTTGFSTFTSSEGVTRSANPTPPPAPTPPPVPPAPPPVPDTTSVGGTGASGANIGSVFNVREPGTVEY